MVAKRYLQHIIYINKIAILAESVKITAKQDTEQYEASQKTEPYAVAFGKATYEIQLNGIDPEHRALFMTWLNRQQLRETANYLLSITTYRYDENGKTQLDYSFTQGYIEEISSENSKPFDCKLVALHRVQ